MSLHSLVCSASLSAVLGRSPFSICASARSTSEPKASVTLTCATGRFMLVHPPPPPVPGGVAPKFGSEKVSRYTGVSQLQLRVSRYTVQLSMFSRHAKEGKTSRVFFATLPLLDQHNAMTKNSSICKGCPRTCVLRCAFLRKICWRARGGYTRLYLCRQCHGHESHESQTSPPPTKGCRQPGQETCEKFCEFFCAQKWFCLRSQHCERKDPNFHSADNLP